MFFQKDKLNPGVLTKSKMMGISLTGNYNDDIDLLLGSLGISHDQIIEMKLSKRCDLLKKQEEINSAIEAKQLAEHKLKLCKNRLEILEAKESKEEEYRKRIHELEVKLSGANANVAAQILTIEDRNIELEQLNKRIDKLIDLKITPQQVKVIKGSNSDVKIIE